MASLAFATPEELGYDPTVIRCYVKGEAGENLIGYRFSLDSGNQYETVSSLSSFRSRRILGRATRVWKVRRIKPEPESAPDGQEKYYALKDTWLYHDAQSEAQIQADIFSKVNTINEIPRDEYEDDFKKYFMTIVEEEIVIINQQQDRTREVVMRGHLLDENCNLFPIQGTRLLKPLRTNHISSHFSASGAPSGLEAEPAVIVTYKPLVHYREVFDDVGATLDELTNLQVLFRALLCALKGV